MRFGRAVEGGEDRVCLEWEQGLCRGSAGVCGGRGFAIEGMDDERWEESKGENERLTPSRYGKTCTQKNVHRSTIRMMSLSSSTPASRESSVTMPAAMSSYVSFSSVLTAFPGASATTVCMCLRTSWFRSSLPTSAPYQPPAHPIQSNVTRRGKGRGKGEGGKRRTNGLTSDTSTPHY